VRGKQTFNLAAHRGVSAARARQVLIAGGRWQGERLLEDGANVPPLVRTQRGGQFTAILIHPVVPSTQV
jgi:hypothetical protein